MQNFTREQLTLINDIKKTLGSDFIWKYLESKNYDVYFAYNKKDENVMRVQPGSDKILLDIIKYTVKNHICSEILVD